MTDLDLRRYESGDADRVWELHVRALSDAGAYDEAFAHRDADLRAVEAEYLDAGGEFLVGDFDGELVAMGAFQPARRVDGHGVGSGADRTAVLRRMRVDPDHQRRGFGTELLAALERRARSNGFERATLDTTPRQRAAMAFYRSHGYEEIRRETHEGFEIVFFESSLFD